MMYIRQMNTGDLNILLGLAHLEGWSSDMFEFELYLGLNPDGCFVCVEDDRVVGGVMTFAYPESGWIGNLIVNRKYRLKGFGKTLLRRAVRHLSHLPALFLCAAPMAVGLYSRFGFCKVIDVYRWECRGRTFMQPEHDSKMENILEIDRNYWCEDRSRMLIPYLKNRFLMAGDGAYLGFGKVGDHWTIGPWEADNKETAATLLAHAVVNNKRERILVDVPSQNTGAWDILTNMGFEVVGRTVFMCRGLLPDIAFGNIYGFASMGSMG